MPSTFPRPCSYCSATQPESSTELSINGPESRTNQQTTYYLDSSGNVLATGSTLPTLVGNSLVSIAGAQGWATYLNGIIPDQVLAIDGQPGIAWAYQDYQGSTAAWR